MNKRDMPYKQYGLYYYPQLPSGMRLATMNDFVDASGQVTIGIDFMVKSPTDPDYECHKIQEAESLQRWTDYITAGLIYVRAN